MDATQAKIVRYKSPVRWPGGKSRALPRLRELMPDLSRVKDYREPFLGGGSVFLYIKSELPPNSGVWLNDLFKPLHRFWIAAQLFNTEIRRELYWLKRSPINHLRYRFDELKKTRRMEDWSATDLFFMNRCAFSGNITGGFSASSAVDRFTGSSIERIADLEGPLKDACISCQDYQKVIEGSGSPQDTFIFLDPPYYGVKGLYAIGGAGEFDHLRLEYVLRKCRYKFMLTYNDTPEVRELYKWADIQPLQIQYGMDNVAGNKPKKGQELIIRNYT